MEASRSIPAGNLIGEERTQGFCREFGNGDHGFPHLAQDIFKMSLAHQTVKPPSSISIWIARLR